MRELLALVAVATMASGSCRRQGSEIVATGLDRGGDAGAQSGDASVPDPEQVTFRTTDEWVIAGELRPRTRGGIAVVLVHQLSSNRGEWGPLLARLSGERVGAPHAGAITTLAIDLRGHGQSTVGPGGTQALWTSFGNDRAQWQGMEQDVAAAVHYVRQRVAASSVVVVGSSLGGTAATLYAARPEAHVAGVALLSPGASYRGIDLIEPLRAVLDRGAPVFAATSLGDATSVDCVGQLQTTFAPFGRLQLERYDAGSAHGVSIAGTTGHHPELWTELERWINAVPHPPMPIRREVTGSDGGGRENRNDGGA